MMIETKHYLESLKKRKKESHIYQKHQLVGLELASLLEDSTHISLYVKLAKAINPQTLYAIAQSIVENTNVKNRGAYFMHILKSEGLLATLQKKHDDHTKKQPRNKNSQPKRRQSLFTDTNKVV